MYAELAYKQKSCPLTLTVSLNSTFSHQSIEVHVVGKSNEFWQAHLPKFTDQLAT